MSEDVPEGVVNLLEMIVRCFDSLVNSTKWSILLTILRRSYNGREREWRGGLFSKVECWPWMNIQYK
ncbi:MAG: hypothetical protein ACFE8V_05095 [Promethearchaeota archaeon]